jgi:type IV pilus assembly protein PilM
LEITQSLGAVATRNRLAGPCSLAVPGHLALTKFIKTPSVAKEKRRKMVEFEAAENIPHPLNEVVWDHVVVADDGFDLEVMLSAVKFDAMQTLCTACDAAGFPVERALPSGMALQHAFRYNYPDVTDSVILVNVGARSTQLLFSESDRYFLRSLAIGGNAVTQSVAEELRIDFNSAETLKIQVLSGKSDLPAASPARAAVHRASATFAARLQLEIMRSTVNHRRQSGANAPVAVYLTGGGSLIADLPAVLAEKLKLRVERYEPLRSVDVSADARAAGAESASAVLADLVGLATRLVVKNESEASLLPPSIIEAIAFRKRQPLLLAAAALSVVALVPPAYYLHQRTEAAAERVRLVDSQLMPLRSVQTRNEGNLQQIEEAKKQIAALRAAFETKSNWLNFLADLQQRLLGVENVWLDRLQVVREAPAEPATPPPANPDGSTPPPVVRPPTLKIVISGRLLDVDNPQSKVSPQSFERVKELLKNMKQSRFVARVENERFDNNQNGLLRFDVTVVIKPENLL